MAELNPFNGSSSDHLFGNIVTAFIDCFCFFLLVAEEVYPADGEGSGGRISW